MQALSARGCTEISSVFLLVICESCNVCTKQRKRYKHGLPAADGDMYCLGDRGELIRHRHGWHLFKVSSGSVHLDDDFRVQHQNVASSLDRGLGRHSFAQHIAI